jgi:hypothetical protein
MTAVSTTSRHCEERKRRSNPFFRCGEMDCFASLAMTGGYFRMLYAASR